MQDYSNSSALAMELLQSCASPSIYLKPFDELHKLTLKNVLKDSNWFDLLQH